MSVSSEARDTRARPANYRRPELLDRVPPSFVTSSGVYAAAAGVVLLYGLVLAAAMPGIKASLKPKPFPLVHNNPATPDRPSAQPVPMPGRERQGRDDSMQKPEGAAAITETDPPKPPDPPPAPADKVETKAQVVRVSPTPVPQVKPESVKVEPTRPALGFKALGKLIDPTTKSKWLAEDEGRVLTAPAKLCFLFPPAQLNTSPRALVGVEGDFDVQVKVVGDAKGELRPGADPVKGGPIGPNGMPISFSGAGLLIWQDETNFLRLERAAWTQNARNIFPQVVCEVWKGGRSEVVVPDVAGAASPLSLRIQRRGADFACAFSLDGQVWEEVKKFKADFNANVEVGVLASNTSKKSFPVRFEGFLVTQGAGGPK